MISTSGYSLNFCTDWRACWKTSFKFWVITVAIYRFYSNDLLLRNFYIGFTGKKYNTSIYAYARHVILIETECRSRQSYHIAIEFFIHRLLNVIVPQVTRVWCLSDSPITSTLFSMYIHTNWIQCKLQNVQRNLSCNYRWI